MVVPTIVMLILKDCPRLIRIPHHPYAFYGLSLYVYLLSFSRILVRIKNFGGCRTCVSFSFPIRWLSLSPTGWNIPTPGQPICARKSSRRPSAPSLPAPNWSASVSAPTVLPGTPSVPWSEPCWKRWQSPRFASMAPWTSLFTRSIFAQSWRSCGGVWQTRGSSP